MLPIYFEGNVNSVADEWDPLEGQEEMRELAAVCCYPESAFIASRP